MLKPLLALLVTAVPAGTPTPRVHTVSLPPVAVVGRPWRAVVSLQPPARATLVAAGPEVRRVPLHQTSRRGRYAATLRFPRSGPWTISVRVRGRSIRLRTVAVDVPRDPLLRDPFALAAEPSGSLLVGQHSVGTLLRLSGATATTVAEGTGVFDVAVAGASTYVAGGDGAVYRVDGASFTRLTPPLDAGSLAVDAVGNIYITQYAGWVKKLAPDGTVSGVAGDGTEGYSGDGGPATAAKLDHPHALAIGRDDALYVGDTENRRIRRIDLATGRITTFGGDVGLTVALDVGPDGSLYSVDVPRNGLGGGLTRTTPDGATTRLASASTANGVAVTPDGTAYVNLWEDKRIQRLDPSTGRLVPFARG